MKTKVKIILLFIVIIGSMFVLTGCSSQAEKEIKIPQVSSDKHVYDEDNILDEATEETLNKFLIELKNKTTVEFVVVTVADLNGYAVEDYANKVFNTMGIGLKEEDNGILLLMSRSDKRVRLEIGRGLEGILNDSKCGRILDQHFVPHREKDDYNQATLLTVQATINVIASDKEVIIEGVDSEAIVKDDSDLQAWIIIIVVIIVFSLMVVDACFFGGVIFSSMSTGEGSSSSGRSGSSGGFGGGRSGGGGASR